LLERYSTAFDGGATRQEGSRVVPKQPRGERIGSDDHELAVVSRNSNGDGSDYFEPGRTEKGGWVPLLVRHHGGRADRVVARFGRAASGEDLDARQLSTLRRHLADDIGALAVVEVGPETITAWQSKLLDTHAPFTVLNVRSRRQRSSRR
jgi:hypothetical protein